jgi:hypothetical protein
MRAALRTAVAVSATAESNDSALLERRYRFERNAITSRNIRKLSLMNLTLLPST